MKFLKKMCPRVVLGLPLLGLLSGCAVYDRVMHPHRLPTPKMDAATKAKVRAAEKARHKGLSLKAAEPAATNATDTEAGADPAAPADAASGAAGAGKKTMSYGELPAGTKVKYDKQGLVKKGFLDRKEADRRKLHHYDTRPLTPNDASRENRKLRKKGHQDHGKGAAAPQEKAAPPDPALDLGPDPGPPPAAAPASPPGAPAPAGTKPASPARAGYARPPAAPKAAKLPPRPRATSDPAPGAADTPVPAPPAKPAKKVKKTPEPQPDPAAPPAKPAKKGKKAPEPKPDPTQPAPG